MNHGVPRAVLIALLAFDVALMALHICWTLNLQGVQAFDAFASPMFQLNRDRSISEWVEYAKSGLTAFALWVAWGWVGQPIYAGLAIVHLSMAADNALTIHERLGRAIGPSIAPGGRFGVGEGHLGEILVFGGWGVLFATIVFFSWSVSMPEHRRVSRSLIFLAAGVGLFAVVLDALDVTPLVASLSKTALILLEDGGETLMLSLNCAVAASVVFALHLRRLPLAGAR